MYETICTQCRSGLIVHQTAGVVTCPVCQRPTDVQQGFLLVNARPTMPPPPRPPQCQKPQRQKGGAAPVLSFLIPGLGQMYKGHVLSGLLWFFAVFLGYVCFILPGFILHICCIVNANNS